VQENVAAEVKTHLDKFQLHERFPSDDESYQGYSVFVTELFGR
jgi:hypothetical protein